MGRRGLQLEILVSLSLAMATATVVLAAMLSRMHDTSLQRLGLLAARTLVSEGRSPLERETASAPGLRWWRVDAAGSVRGRSGNREALDVASAELAREAARLRAPLLQAGASWQAIRFAVPLEGGDVAVARLPAAVSPWLVVGLLAADVAVFTAFGAFLLRRRVVQPLQRLAAAARAITGGDAAAVAPLDGSVETREVAQSFNQMTASLARRSEALEKAVSELRASNRSLREARAGLDRAERMAAVGRLAAGVAHEVGNPMGAVLAFLDLIGRDSGLSTASREHVERAAREGARVRTILRQLLDFSRPPRTARVPVDLLRVCEDSAALIRAQRRYGGIAIDVRALDDPPPALADPDTVAQIVLNLLLNAADALSEGVREPTIHLELRPAAARCRPGDDPASLPSRRRFDSVECSVSDNGPGVAEEDRERIFDPFFSTKAPGEGTGLGLANALRFAEEFGGSLSLVEDPQRPGATFVLRLPAAGVGDAAGAAREAH